MTTKDLQDLQLIRQLADRLLNKAKPKRVKKVDVKVQQVVNERELKLRKQAIK